MKIRKVLGYSAATLTLVAAVLVPFVLINLFARGVDKAGLRIDELYTAGPVVRTIEKEGYKIQVHREVRPRLLQRSEGYVQLAWEPAKSLPQQIADQVDIDGDGNADIRVTFASPEKDHGLKVNVESLNAKYTSLRDVGQESFSRMIALVQGKVVVRIPVAR